MIPAEQQYPNMSSPLIIISILILITMLFFATIGFFKKSILGYTLLWYFGTLFLMSNIIFPIGAFMNERFIYIPSIGFAILISYWVIKISKKHFLFIQILLCISLLTFATITITRNNVWKNDSTLALNDVNISKGSTKVKMSAGIQYMQNAAEETNLNKQRELYKKAILYLEESIKIHPRYNQSIVSLSRTYYQLKEYEKSALYAIKLAKVNKIFENKIAEKINIANCRELLNLNKIDEAIEIGNNTLKYYPNSSELYKIIGEAYGRYKLDFKNAEKYMLKSIKINSNDSQAYQNIGILYAQAGFLNKAKDNFEKAYQLTPNNKQIINNMIILYRQLGNNEKIIEYQNKLIELTKKSK